jgi:nucleoside-diphosphate kinase
VRQLNIDFLMEGPVIAIALEGVSAIEAARKLVGPTEPKAAQPGTIRGDYAHVCFAYADKKNSVVRNLIHASEGNDAKTELELWFRPEELHTYRTVHDIHLV